MAVPPFERKPPPMAALAAAGVLMRGVFTPMMWVMRKLGRAEKMLGSMSDRREREVVRKNPFRDYAPGPQDVFVMTYAKSGTNWMMQIVYQLIHHGKGEFNHIHDAVPWPDAELMGPIMRNYAVPVEQATEWQNAPERKRIVKTHLNWELLPYAEEARYIAVIRDPKDVFVSAYCFMKDFGLVSGMAGVDIMFRVFLAGKFMLGGSWPANAAGYWAQRRRPNVLVVSFASMKRELEATVRRVADFLEIHVTDEVIQAVCERSSFEYMKRIDHKFRPFKMTPWGAPPTMIRKGRQGGSGELLTPEQQRELDAYCVAELKRLGSDLPYEEICGVLPATAATEAVSGTARS